jgi:hypothetical protein
MMAREIRTKEYLQERISEEASKHAECAGVQFGGVYWHEAEESGCNWSVSIVSGPEWSDCFIAVEQFIFGLREQYNIPELNDPVVSV